ncbi:MAG: hypothetical protein J6Y90_00065 [Lachnospiraceae bacterium]|nr:hypothetical protein [Lachnospiraceae bacterium]
MIEYNLDLQVIDGRMHELEWILGYTFNDVRNLSNAMCGIRLNSAGSGPKIKDTYNSSLALVGDSILKAVLSEELFRRGLSKMDITEIKKGLEGNETLFDMSENIGLRRFVYNENGFYPDIKGKELPQYGVHNQYLEAIIGSVYFDSDYETCKEWLLSRFYTKEVLDVHVKFSIRC